MPYISKFFSAAIKTFLPIKKPSSLFSGHVTCPRNTARDLFGYARYFFNNACRNITRNFSNHAKSKFLHTTVLLSTLNQTSKKFTGVQRFTTLCSKMTIILTRVCFFFSISNKCGLFKRYLMFCFKKTNIFFSCVCGTFSA